MRFSPVCSVRSSALFVLLGIAVISVVQARSSVAIVNHEDILVATGSGHAPSEEDVRRAIVAGASSVPHYPWTVSGGEPGAPVATTVVRSKSTVSVNIKYSSTKYSVTYRDSTNMNYEVDKKGRPEIHPYYNTWVQQFIDAINLQLMKL